jgi:hypothetical protein
MSETDTRLRELLEIAVGEPPGSVSVPKVRHLARRRRALQTAAAATAACVCVSMVAVAASGLASGQPSAPGPSAAGVPRYYIQQGTVAPNGNWAVQPAVIRDTATGAVTAAVNCPWAGATMTSGIAAASDETFFMTCVQTRESGTRTVRVGSQVHRIPVTTVIGSRIYRFRVTSAGTVDGYSLVPGGALPGRDVDGLTAAAGGSAIAMVTSPDLLPISRGGDGVLVEGQALLVINTSTGAHATWYWTSPKEIATNYSLSADGQDLTFVITNSQAEGFWLTGRPARPQTIELAQVSPASRGGLLSSARLHVRLNLPPGSLIYYAQPSPGQSVLTVAELTSLPGDYAGVTVGQVSVATGKLIRVLFQGTGPIGAVGFSATASSDPSGRHIILIYGGPTTQHNGWLDGSRLVPLVPAKAAYETW